VSVPATADQNSKRARNLGPKTLDSVPGAFWLPKPFARQTTANDGRRLIWMAGRANPVRPRTPARRGKRTREQIRAARAEQVGRWRRMLAEGVYPTRAALARAEGVSRAAVTQGLGRRN